MTARRESPPLTFGVRIPISAMMEPARSLALDVRCLDNRPPLLDFGFGEGNEGLRCLLLARRDFLTHIGKPRPYCRIGKRIHHGDIELLDHGSWRAFGSVEPKPT